MLQRLKRLPASAPAMARAVAILGEGAKPALATELAGLDAPTAEEALDALCRADVLTRDGTTGSASSTRSCARRSTATCPVHARSDGHARAARLLPAARRGGRLAHRPLPRPRGDAWAVEALRAAAQRALVAR